MVDEPKQQTEVMDKLDFERAGAYCQLKIWTSTTDGATRPLLSGYLRRKTSRSTWLCGSQARRNRTTLPGDCLNRDVVVQGNPRGCKALGDQLTALGMVLTCSVHEPI